MHFGLEMLEKNEKLVCSLAHAMATKLNYNDVDELISFGREKLLDCVKDYEPARGAFTTYLTWVLRSRMMNYVERMRRMQPMTSLQNDANPDGVSWTDRIPDHRISDALPPRFQDLLANCSDRAKEVIDICLTHNIAIFGKRDAKGTVRNILKERGWPNGRIEHTFNELSGAIAAW